MNIPKKTDHFPYIEALSALEGNDPVPFTTWEQPMLAWVWSQGGKPILSITDRTNRPAYQLTLTDDSMQMFTDGNRGGTTTIQEIYEWGGLDMVNDALVALGCEKIQYDPVEQASKKTQNRLDTLSI